MLALFQMWSRANLRTGSIVQALRQRYPGSCRPFGSLGFSHILWTILQTRGLSMQIVLGRTISLICTRPGHLLGLSLPLSVYSMFLHSSSHSDWPCWGPASEFLCAVYTAWSRASLLSSSPRSVISRCRLPLPAAELNSTARWHSSEL